MKKLLLVLLATMSVSLSAIAQDVIVLKNAEEVQAKVESIGLQDVTYRKWSNLEGPTYTLLKSEIFFIKYANGEKETFTNIETRALRPKTDTKKQLSQEDFANIKFQGYAYIGADFTAVAGGPSLDLNFGARFSKCLYVGGGVGWHHLMKEEWLWNHKDTYTLWLHSLAFTADLKAYIPTRTDFYPRFDLSVGGGAEFWDFTGRFYMSVGAGFDYRKFSFGVGYKMPVGAGYIIPTGYVRLGMRFGKK